MGKFSKRTIKDVPIDNKTVLVRVDYNVPLDEDGKIADDFRIQASLGTIRYLMKRGCKVVLISHLGRPEGREEKFSLAPVAKRLGELLGKKAIFVEDCIGDKVRMAVKKASKNTITLLENLRFYKEEEANDQKFAKSIARDTGARYFVQDGFGVVHRAHASTDAITCFAPSVAGLLLEREIRSIRGVMDSPKHPVVAILGGAKVSDKMPVIEALEPIADKILIGGAMANTFLRVAGVNLGKSKCEDGQEDQVSEIYELAKNKVGAENVDDFLVLPKDLAAGEDVHSSHRESFNADEFPADKMALDIGDETIEQFVDILKDAKTVIWNGTLGYAENEAFAHGSARVALALATSPEVTSVIGGGDTADFVRDWDAKKGGSFSHVSTGGGASLELIAGDKLPGVEALLDA